MKTHTHYWKKLFPADETGGFVYCKCGDLIFLAKKQMNKFEKLTKSGVKGNYITVSPVNK